MYLFIVYNKKIFFFSNTFPFYYKYFEINFILQKKDFYILMEFEKFSIKIEICYRDNKFEFFINKIRY